MFIREVLLQLHDQVGDGTATAAVLFQTIYNQGIHYLTSGGNARRLQTYLEHGMRVILDQLSGMTRQVEGKGKLAQVADQSATTPPWRRCWARSLTSSANTGGCKSGPVAPES